MTQTPAAAPRNTNIVNRARLAFRRLRRTRPFWAALWTFYGGLAILVLPLTDIGTLVRTGLPGVGGVAIGALIMTMALFFLFAPSQRHVTAVITAIAALVSFPLSNLGGFFFGMFFSLLGASMAFGWVPEKPKRKRRWGRPIPRTTQSGLPSTATDGGHDAPGMAATPA